MEGYKSARKARVQDIWVNLSGVSTFVYELQLIRLNAMNLVHAFFLLPLIACDSCVQHKHFTFRIVSAAFFCWSNSQVVLGKTVRLYKIIVFCVCWRLRFAAEPAGITVLAGALSAGASFTISLFQLINYPVAYLTVISVCAWEIARAGKGWDRSVMKVRGRENEHLRVV